MKKLILKLLQNYLAIWARLYLSKTKPIVIWITWSVWKTSCRVIIHQVFKKFLSGKKVYSSPKNFNSEIWLPFSIFWIENYKPWIFSLLKISILISFKALFSRPDYDVIVLEYWLDYAYMDLLLKSAKPDIAIFTKLDSIHLEFFNSVEEIWFEKFKLIHAAKRKAYLNYKDDFARSQFDQIKVSKSYYCWNDIEANAYDLIKENNNILAKFKAWNKTIKTNLLWEENAEYIALAFDILDNIWEENNKQKKEIYLDLELQAWRFSIFPWIKNSILVDSSYNAGPTSMKKMIENTFALREKLFPENKIALVLWEMRELWKETEKSHKDLVNCLDWASVILTIWKDMKDYFIPEVEKSKKDFFFESFISSREAWTSLKNILEKGSKNYIILFKWSQNTIFIEEALKEVLVNKNDVEHLVRQNDFWIEKKENFFNSIK